MDKVFDLLILIVFNAFPILIILGTIQTLLIFWAKKKFNFVFPNRNFDNKISMKKVREILKSGKIENPKLVRVLRVIISLDYLLTITFGIVLLSFGLLLLSKF